MTKLERRCRLFLRAYPEQYRRERGGEMLGTLLDTTPQGRTWPLLRDVCALLAGGVRARAAMNMQLSLGANLRTAAYAGISAYLGLISVADLGDFAHAVIAAASGRTQLIRSYDWAYVVGMALIALTVALAVANSRRAVVLAGALPAAALMYYGAAGDRHLSVLSTSSLLIDLAILVALSGKRTRLAPWWRWPVGSVAVLPLLLIFGPGAQVWLLFALLMALGATSLAWIAIDARPAIAVCVFLFAYWMPITIADFAFSPSALGLVLPAITIAIAALAAWRLRSQSAHAPRRRI